MEKNRLKNKLRSLKRQHIQTLGVTTLDFTVQQAQQGKLYIFQSRIGNDLDFTAVNSVNQVVLYNCEFLGDINQTGGDIYWYSSTTFGNITITSQDGSVNTVAPQVIDTRFYGSGGGSILPLDGSTTPPYDGPSFTFQNTATGTFTHHIEVDLAGFNVSGTLNMTGDGNPSDTVVFASADGVPSIADTTITNGVNFILTTFANGIGYVPTTPANWSGTPPATVQEALDRMSNLLVTLNSSNPIP